MKFLASFLLLVSFAASAAEPQPPAQPQATPAAEAAVRVAVVQAQAAEPALPVRKVPAPQGWLLLVAGLALAGWIAHRRLSYF